VLTLPRVNVLPSAATVVFAAGAAACLVALASRRGAATLARVANRLFPWRPFRLLRALVEGWEHLHGTLGNRRWGVLLLSVVLWFVSCAQIWLFARAVGIPVPFWVSVNLAAIALIAGLAPLTVAGLGARDVAFVVLLARYATPEAAAAVGILASTRLFLPAVAALPILRPYLKTVVEASRVRHATDPAPA
jgi:uncharacterized membrane protein YbhN (UPF0104 family)